MTTTVTTTDDHHDVLRGHGHSHSPHCGPLPGNELWRCIECGAVVDSTMEMEHGLWDDFIIATNARVIALEEALTAALEEQATLLNALLAQVKPVRLHAPTIPTYSAGVTNVVAAALASDVFTISGAAGKIVRVLRMGLSATSTAGNQILLQVLRRGGLNVGGVSVPVPAVPYDSDNPAAAAAVKSYSLNPVTLANLLGVVRTISFAAPTNAADTMGLVMYDFSVGPGQPPVLRGPDELLAVNLLGATVAGGRFSFWAEWTEEDEEVAA